jgi:hypothetical protein
LLIEAVLVVAATGTYPSHSIQLEKNWYAYQRTPTLATESAWKAERDRLRNIDRLVLGTELVLLIANGLMIGSVLKNRITASRDAALLRLLLTV